MPSSLTQQLHRHGSGDRVDGEAHQARQRAAEAAGAARRAARRSRHEQRLRADDLVIRGRARPADHAIDVWRVRANHCRHRLLRPAAGRRRQDVAG